MTEEEIAVKLTGNDHEINSLKHRMAAVENQAAEINRLVLSIQKLTLNIEELVKEQTKQGERLASLEKEPADNWKLAKKTALTAAISLIAGALVAAAIIAIAKNL